MTLDDWLKQAESRLRGAGIETPLAEARLLAMHTLGRSRAWVLTHGEDSVDEESLEPWIARRERREPLAHLTGVREFYGRGFRVTPDTLVPRDDTETLVTLALAHAPPGARVLDIGTGTGCIGITMKLERPDLDVTLVDISPAALAVASENAARLDAKVRAVESDLFASLLGERFDLVVSNPPYIRRDAELMPEVGRYEPAAALFGGEDGLAIYRRLAREAPPFLSEGGLLLVEIGFDQGEAVPEAFDAEGWTMIERQQDLAGIDRAIAFHRP